jgi:asparagine synthase (glutamine-hydrolysing)
MRRSKTAPRTACLLFHLEWADSRDDLAVCGISGFLLSQVSWSHRDLEARLQAMIAMLRHRGPDDEGVWTDRRAGLAHSRLSIIDLSAAGHQPMASADETAWITYNGEIYNSRDPSGSKISDIPSVAAVTPR